MAISLSSLGPVTARPFLSTIAGDGGIGKTSLAALWPNPVFIRTEDGILSLAGNETVRAFPVAKTVGDVFDQLTALATEPHEFRTVVIDSITKFNIMAEADVLARDKAAGSKANSIVTACGGYGAGFSALSNVHRELREACEYLLREKNMYIVFIAHAEIETLDLPDQDQFSRYTIRLHKKSLSFYTDDVDLVAFVKLQTFTSGDENDRVKKATSTGARVITCYPHPAHLSKNRLGIKKDLVFVEGVNPFAEYLK